MILLMRHSLDISNSPCLFLLHISVHFPLYMLVVIAIVLEWKILIQPKKFHYLFTSVRIRDEEGPNNSVLLRDGWYRGAKISQQPQTIQRREAGGVSPPLDHAPPSRRSVGKQHISDTFSFFCRAYLLCPSFYGAVLITREAMIPSSSTN